MCRLTQRLATALQAHRHLRGERILCLDNGRPMPDYVVESLLKKAARRANLRNNGPHILRHTFCSHLAMRGAPARSIQELAGHRDLTTTQRYMHLSPNAINDAIRLLEAHGPLRSPHIGVETIVKTGI
jgi:site-specific recombinase XerD